MNKKGIRYLRFSSKGQSNSSIEAQEMYTSRWFETNKVELTDTFIDAGFSAKTFDRPDMNELTAFIAKHYKSCDYLVVSEMDRFSRDAGEAISLIKKLQLKYSVQIVSVTEGITYDYRDSGSFFRTGLSFLLAEDDNIRRANKINSGIYTAKAQEGRFIGAKAPYGYLVDGKGKARKLVINETEAIIVRFIYDSYLTKMPIYMIKSKAIEMGMKLGSKCIIQDMLENPIYSGQQNVKSWRTLPGGIFPAKHEPVIDMLTWQRVQEKLNGKDPKTLTLIRDEFPLRGILLCHCGLTVTGAPSKGRLKWYNYYKCKKSTGHLNVGTIKAHSQLREMLRLMSPSNHYVIALEERSKAALATAMEENKKLIVIHKEELGKVEKKLASVERKWIDDQLTFESYHRNTKDLTQQRIFIKAKIDELNADDKEAYILLYGNIKKLTDMVKIYECANTIEKQELIRMVFDSKLYYQAGSYRTPYIMNIFSHNLLEMKEKKLLILDEKAGSLERTRLGGE